MWGNFQGNEYVHYLDCVYYSDGFTGVYFCLTYQILYFKHSGQLYRKKAINKKEHTVAPTSTAFPMLLSLEGSP